MEQDLLRLARLLDAHHKVLRDSGELSVENKNLKERLEAAQDESQRLRAEVDKNLKERLEAAQDESQRLRAEVDKQNESLGKEVHEISLKVKNMQNITSQFGDKAMDLEKKIGDEKKEISKIKRKLYDFDREMRASYEELVAGKNHLLDTNDDLSKKLGTEISKTTALSSEKSEAEKKLLEMRAKYEGLTREKSKIVKENRRLGKELKVSKKKMTDEIVALLKIKVGRSKEKKSTLLAKKHKMSLELDELNYEVAKANGEVNDYERKLLAAQEEVFQLQEVGKHKKELQRLKSHLQEQLNVKNKEFKDLCAKVMSKGDKVKALIANTAMQEWLAMHLVELRMKSLEDSIQTIESAISEKCATVNKELSRCLEELQLVEAETPSLQNEIQVLQGEEAKLLIKVLEMEVLSVCLKEQARTLSLRGAVQESKESTGQNGW